MGGGLHLARRLNVRIAEVTDLVTELVLPLHQREIAPEVLARLDPDTPRPVPGKAAAGRR